MNSLIRSISISLLSLVGMGTGFANSEPEMAFEIPQYTESQGAQGAALHEGSQVYGDAVWDEQDKVSPVAYKDWAFSPRTRVEESRLSPEQRRALRHEINEAGRELYRKQ